MKNRTMKNRFATAVVALAIVGGAAACGDDTDDTGADDGTETTVEEGTETTVEEGTETTVEEGTETTVAEEGAEEESE